MRNIIPILILVLYCALYNSVAAAEQDSSLTDGATVSIYADRDSVHVYEGGLYLGTAPCDSLSVQPGTHVFTYILGDRKDWLHSERTETLTIASSEHIVRNINFPAIFRITSEPYGAEIHVGDSVAGKTPFILSTNSQQNFIVLTKEGYREAAIPLDRAQTFINVKLETLDGLPATDKERYLSVEPSDNNLDIYLVTGATVLSGVVSAYCKIKADSYYSAYRRTNDPFALQKVRSYDTAAGISLAASEIGLFFLSYLLLSR
jgi:hypothetical protein